MEVAAGDGSSCSAGPNGSPSTQATTQLLALRPQLQGRICRREMVVTVHSNECGQIRMKRRTKNELTRCA